jgi:starch-binding outer membrane protein, SusD/RagB family
MKNIKYKIIIPLFLACLFLMYACKKSFLNVPSYGTLSQATLANKAGVEGLLIGAYSMLDGTGAIGTPGGTPGLKDPTGGIWEVSADNWIYGSVAGGDDHKGSDPGDQPDIVPIQNYTENASNGFFADKWANLYAAVQRCNDVLRTMAQVTDGSMTPADTLEVRAEAVFLRAVYHFEAKKLWNNVPWIDESVDFSNGNYLVPNTVDIWPKIEADLQFAITNLPATQNEIARANKYAAEGFLAKAFMFEHKYTNAQTLLTDMITNGKTAGGAKYALVPKYGDNFDAAHKNNSEDIFSAQNSVDPNSAGSNGNAGDVLNFPYGGPSTCCGFYQPSYSLVNSFKTDATTGLPLLDGSYNDVDMKSDEGLPPAPTTGADWFVPYAGTVDPRLDWSVGRRGIPYLDWGPDPGASWVRNQASAGPYLPIKYIVKQSEAGVLSTQYGGWATNQATADNYVYIRYAEVLLWAAECAAQANDFATATTYVNMIRERAANPAGFVQNAAGTGPAANYFIKDYATFPDQATALKAIQFESKIELSSEGNRFFNLVRWGIADTELDAYITHESTVNHISPDIVYPDPNGGASKNSNALAPNFYILVKGATFSKGKNEYYPIPQLEIDASVAAGKSSLTQNPGY